MALLRMVLAASILRELSALQLSMDGGSWPGLTAPLDDAGYQYMLSMQDGSQLWRFIRRVIFAHQGSVTDEASFDRFVESCWAKPIKQRTFDALVKDLSTALFVTRFSSQAVGQTLDADVTVPFPSVNLFIAGVEGSGHHFVKLLMDACINLGACRIDPELTRTLWDSREDKLGLTQAWNEAAARYHKSSNSTAQLRVLNAYGRTDHLGELTYTGMMPYPSFSAEWVPRLDLYSEVATAAGDRLFALVLVRNPASLLCSHFARYHHTEEEELAALDALVQQLRTLSPSTYKCLDYDSLPAIPLTLDRFLSELFQSSRTSIKATDLITTNFQQSNLTCAEQVAPDALERFVTAQESLFDLCRQADGAPTPANVFVAA